MIIDTHCHLHHAAFADVRETLRTALAHDVWGMIAVGCDPDTNVKTLAAAATAPKAVWAALGYHPDWVYLSDAHLEQVEQQVRDHQSRHRGPGEIGLPWYSLQRAPDAPADGPWSRAAQPAAGPGLPLRSPCVPARAPRRGGAGAGGTWSTASSGPPSTGTRRPPT